MYIYTYTHIYVCIHIVTVTSENDQTVFLINLMNPTLYLLRVQVNIKTIVKNGYSLEFRLTYY